MLTVERPAANLTTATANKLSSSTTAEHLLPTTATLSDRDAAYLAARLSLADAIRLGYRTVRNATELHRPAAWLRHPDTKKSKPFGQAPGFGGPALEIPIRDATGAVVSWQAVPATPRIGKAKPGKTAKPVKKESPRGARLTVHVPLGVGPLLADPTQPIAWTESPLKADALTLAGLPTIGLCGVDGFKTRVGDESRPLPELEEIPLNGRVVYLVNDSDLHTGNNDVAGAYRRQCDYVTGRGGIPLDASPPPTPDGEKQGPDDFIKAGGATAQLISLAIQRLASSRAPAPTMSPPAPDRMSRCDCTDCPDRASVGPLRQTVAELRGRLDLYRSGNWSLGQAKVVDEVITRAERFRRRDWTRITLDYSAIGNAVDVSPSTVGEVVRRLKNTPSSPLLIGEEAIIDRDTGLDTGRKRYFGDLPGQGDYLGDLAAYATLARPGATESGAGGMGGARPGAGRPRKVCPRHPDARLIITTAAEATCQDCGHVADRWVVGRPRIIDPSCEDGGAGNQMNFGPPTDAGGDVVAALAPTVWNTTRLPEPEAAPPPATAEAQPNPRNTFPIPLVPAETHSGSPDVSPGAEIQLISGSLAPTELVCIDCGRPSPHGTTPCWRCASSPIAIGTAADELDHQHRADLEPTAPGDIAAALAALELDPTFSQLDYGARVRWRAEVVRRL